MKRYHLVSGKVECTESGHLAAALEAFFADEGYARARSREEAQVVVLNGCDRITATPGVLAELKRWAADHPRALVLALGCLPDSGGEGNFRVLPSWRLAREPGLIGPALGFSRAFALPLKDARAAAAVGLPGSPKESELCVLTIGSGCRSACSYCSIKDGRGPCRSAALEGLVEQARGAAARGRARFLLLADDAGAWGHDLGLDLADLLAAVARACPGARFHIRPMSPVALPRLLPRLRAFLPSVDHVYLPIQSGSDRLLKLMRRGYTAAQALGWVAALRRAHPGIYLETDVIVGFPTETRAEFTASVKAAAAFDHAAFQRYTPYPGTPAAAMKGAVPAAELSARMETVRRLSRRYPFTAIDPSSFCYEGEATEGSGSTPKDMGREP